MKSHGSVMGIDVGWSTKYRSSAVCRLSWNCRDLQWTVYRFCATARDREKAIREAAADRTLTAVAIDGPLRRGFSEIGRYRSAERLLSRGEIKRIGKPEQSSSPNGKKLNFQANLAAKCAKQHCRIEAPTHPVQIDAHSIAEAFPTTFLGVMIDDRVAVPGSNRKSDRYFAHLAKGGHLDRLLEDVLPGRKPAAALKTVRDHDERAALVCALTALCVAAGDFVAVGDDRDGWIILPPKRRFAQWAWTAVCQTAAREEGEGRLKVVGNNARQKGMRMPNASSGHEHITNGWENSETVGPETLDRLQSSLTVNMLMTARNDLVTCRYGERVQEVMARNVHCFSYLPVKDEAGEIVGLFNADTCSEEQTQQSSVGYVYESMAERHLIGSEASIVKFVMSADTLPVCFVVAGEGIAGLVTISDLQKLPARAALFTLVTSLEIAMSERIQREWPENPEKWIGLLSVGRRRKLEKAIEDAKREDTFVSEIVLTQLKDKARIICRQRLVTGMSNRKLSSCFEKIEDLRNMLAHANHYAYSADKAREVCSTTRDIVSIRDSLLGTENVNVY